MKMSTNLIRHNLTKTPLWVFAGILCLFSLSVFADLQHEYSSEHLSQQSCDYSHHVKPFTDTSIFLAIVTSAPCISHLNSNQLPAHIEQTPSIYTIRGPPN
jgi:hypothetical protein